MSEIVDLDSDSADGNENEPRRSSRARRTINIDHYNEGPTASLRKLNLNTNKFMENFNPETSARERRKLKSKLLPNKKLIGAIYDERGVHMESGRNMCDCLEPNCVGCHFPCPKCGSQKCGSECRVNRKFIYEQIDYEGVSITYKNPLKK